MTKLTVTPARKAPERKAIVEKRAGDTVFILENQGQLPSEVGALVENTPTEFSNATTLTTLCAKLMPTYIPALPTDPSLNTGNINDCAANAGAWGDTGYQIERDVANRITVIAPTTDNGATISVTR